MTEDATTVNGNPTLTINVLTGQDADAEQLVDETLSLRQSLLELDIDSADLVRPPESGAGRGAGLSAGEILVTLSTSSALLGAVVRTIQSWLRGRTTSSVVIELNGNRLELTNVAPDQAHEVAKGWIASVTNG